MARYSRRAQRHAKESAQRTKKMLRQAKYRSGPVRVSWLPGFEPPTKTKWNANQGVCPKCLELGQHDDGLFPLRTRSCSYCGFEYTLWLGDPRPVVT